MLILRRLCEVCVVVVRQQHLLNGILGGRTCQVVDLDVRLGEITEPNLRQHLHAIVMVSILNFGHWLLNLHRRRNRLLDRFDAILGDLNVQEATLLDLFHVDAGALGAAD